MLCVRFHRNDEGFGLSSLDLYGELQDSKFLSCGRNPEMACEEVCLSLKKSQIVYLNNPATVLSSTFFCLYLDTAMLKHHVSSGGYCDIFCLFFCLLPPFILFILIDMNLRVMFLLMWTQKLTGYSSSRLWPSSW